MKDIYETILERKEDALVRARVLTLANDKIDPVLKQTRLDLIDNELAKKDVELQALRTQRSVVS